MTRLSSARDDIDWDKELADIEKRMVHRNEAQKLYDEKKLKDGVMFQVAGAKMQNHLSAEEKPAWAVGMFLYGKFLYCIYSANDRRLPRLKRQAVANLMEIRKTGMVDTRQSTTLPSRYQDLKNPDFVLHAKTSTDTDPEGGTMTEHQQVFDVNESFEHPGIIKD